MPTPQPSGLTTLISPESRANGTLRDDEPGLSGLCRSLIYATFQRMAVLDQASDWMLGGIKCCPQATSPPNRSCATIQPLTLAKQHASASTPSSLFFALADGKRGTLTCTMGRSACTNPAFRRVQTFPLSDQTSPRNERAAKTADETTSVRALVAQPSAHWPPFVVLRTLRNAGCVDRRLLRVKPWEQQKWHNSTSQARDPPTTTTAPSRRGFHSSSCHRESDDKMMPMLSIGGLPRSNSCKTHAKARLKETLTPDLLEKLRRFWFKHLKTDEAYILPQRSQMGRWFYSDVDFDEACVKKFRPVLEAMKSAKITTRDILTIVRPFTPLQWLGLVLLLDQVPRNIYRGPESSTVFKFFDPIAREIARHAINAGAATHNRIKYRVAYRMWFYLPFMHSEDLALHDFAVAQYQQMKDDFEELMAEDGEAGSDDQRKCWGVLAVQKEAARDLLETNCDFETKHRDIIVQFGRYPHRNMAMGRESTAQEKKYLETGGETFSAAS
ncbi:uncharacterized protein CLUP02_00482 [Colletotrichum lupini]|uniref:Uncharacterized protein n=2 Tax=Colletotrichum acutatum species complex TaxID=2707335 RepID=A0A9Q8W906_9PEZI|nr:uncharacterized protein CLUP02_00482 [Colletotrichum lupini]UQC73835.1 hypothetical protein CLUP02_00482 [Colletotrichum lupini]